MSNRRWFRDIDPSEYSDWYKQQDQDQQWIEENKMNYSKVFEGFLNDNSEGVIKNAKAPKYRSSGSGKSAIVITQDIPAGSVIAIAAWGGKGQYGNYIRVTGQVIQPDYQPPQQNYPNQQQNNQQATSPAPQVEQEPFDDDIPF